MFKVSGVNQTTMCRKWICLKQCVMHFSVNLLELEPHFKLLIFLLFTSLLPYWRITSQQQPSKEATTIRDELTGLSEIRIRICFQTVLHLDRSSRAVRVFSRLRDYIAEKGLDAPISVEDWQKEFLAAEEEAGHPFPLNTNWDHCAGSSTQYRGYTCGLWTTFHALTVSAFKNWQAKTNGTFRKLIVKQNFYR